MSDFEIDAETMFAAADAALRAVARAGVAVDRARLAARTRYAPSDEYAARLAEANRIAGRAAVKPVEAGTTAILGRAMNADGTGRAKVTVHALGGEGRAATASATTDANGVFRLTIVPREKSGDVVLVIADGKDELFRDAKPWTPAPGRVTYREVVLAT